ncbi:Kinesin-like protein NACK2 [Acorus gramineus]|uniref:Kinesin-like protein NACK2 n=1 Tax=Acorus gramineus TaxID=55184 RepID=A0AAV9BB53_ACOGR|nr:Kinesin-like protein NACK2 [Acorus gramineus]
MARRSSSPFGLRRPSSSSSSSSSLMSGRLIPRSSPQIYGGFSSSRSSTPSRGRSDRTRERSPVPIGFASSEDLIGLDDVPRSSGSDSISVTVRFRPLSEREFQRGDEIAWYADGDKIVRSEVNHATAYAFDRVFGPSTTSKTVYDVAARPVVKGAMEGINGTVFAYGVTSSGKTHTMHGDQHTPGIIPLAIQDVFSIIQDTPGREFLLRVSYLEIYNEVINDLLDPTGQNLRVREDGHGTYVEGIKEEVVLSTGHALSFIAAGEEHRHVGSNNFNLLSSRSHTIFTLMIESSDRDDEYDGVIFSQLNLIDLAGSESSKTETTGLRRKEGSYINKSLLTLGTVIGKLSEGKASHIPYRDSKLTRLLQSSLSGHGHVSLICTVTPASSNMEETHNTLKFASRAKRVEIYASRNRIIDEKSLIKKYQKEISVLKQELDHLRRGMLAGVSQEEIMSLRQQLEEGQVKMQSRLEEEEEAKAALMSRIQRLTKLILVSTKNTIQDDKVDTLRESSSVTSENESTLKDSSGYPPSLQLEPSSDSRIQGYPSKRSEEQSSINSSVDLTQTGLTGSDQMDLLVEQVKMLAGEIAFSTSTLKRLVEQSANSPEGSQIQIQNLEHEIQEKKRQLSLLEQRITESSEASLANASFVDMQQTVMKLTTQCNEKSFELELKAADNRVLQEQLNNKCSENKKLEEKIILLQQKLTAALDNKSTLSSEQCVSEEYVDELKKKIQSQESENERIKLEHIHLQEENAGLISHNQKLSEEASYAKELASAAAVELKNLAGQVTKLSVQNARQAKEILALQETTRGASMQNINGGIRKFSEGRNDGMHLGRRGRSHSRGSEISNPRNDEFEYRNLAADDIKIELQARKQREDALEAALAEKELAEEEYKKRLEEAKKRETALENDLAGMWVLVAKLKKGAFGISELSVQERTSNGTDLSNDLKENNDDNKDSVLKERQLSDGLTRPVNNEKNQNSELEPLLVRLKARMQEMKEKDLGVVGNGDANSHMCKVCFETPTAAILLPCRHFCLCKPCSLACSECPVCRTKIGDRIIAFTS